MAIQKKGISEARRILLEGKVQGVGLRPFVYRLAHKFNFCGTVANTEGGVIIEVEGNPRFFEAFIANLTGELPPLAAIARLTVQTMPPQKLSRFTIETTRTGCGPTRIQLPPDAATCRECRAEIDDARERRHQYPFTNCTNCGPRFTIVKNMPYDREKTTMAHFPLCPDCAGEYENPKDRRFHAQPIACPACGPHMTVVTGQGKPLPGDWQKTAREALKVGQIIALKGLGGFHLACDALNAAPVNRLRRQKNRGSKPFAVMARDLGAAKKYCSVDDAAKALLTSAGAPIVTCLMNNHARLPQGLAPGLTSLGVMLPYTPLHLLLFDADVELLVMTSGNMGGLPLTVSNEAALAQLAPLADIFLLHDREIANRCDDSVILPPYSSAKITLPAILIRRSRGYVPEALRVPGPAGLQEAVTGCGAEMKNTFCILKGETAYVSQHLGEMAFVEGRDAFREAYGQWCSLVSSNPAVLGYDPHPGYAITPTVLHDSWRATYPVQHHHAHMAAVMGEHGVQEEVLAAILDGSGYGLDGNIWGFEILSGDFLHFRRLYHMRYMPLPGGEKAIREPWRSALSLLYQGTGAEEALETGVLLFNKEAREVALAIKLLKAPVHTSLNTPLVSSGGRLFDAAAALLGVCQKNTYEGEAALKLSELVIAKGTGPGQKPALYAYDIGGSTIDFSSIAREMAAEVLAGKDRQALAWKFHCTLAQALTDLLLMARQKSGLKKVVLGGGVFQNRVLLLLCKGSLEDAGFQVYFSSRVPPNDGGLSLGQALVAAWRRWHDVSGHTCQDP